MPAPTTTDQLLVNLRKSGLVSAADLDAILADAPADETPRAVLDRLVTAELLTPFQADRLAAGKYKGFVLGSYVILDKLGGGGMGQVFLAEHTAMHRLVALKVLAGGSDDDGVARERFLREARAAAALRHPNIIGVHDLRTEGNVSYLVMEYVEGLTLQQLVARFGKLESGAAADYARQIALGLQHAHDAGLVHRDIKPANLFLARDGTVKILDLGLVREMGDTDSKLTGKVDKAILGTADYLAPEQAVNSSLVDHRADVYSLGATLYFLLAGRPLFPEGRTAQKLMWQQLREPTPIRELCPDVPAGLAAAVHRALAKEPADRFSTAAEMVAALDPWAAPPTPPDPARLPVPPRRRGLRLVAAGRPGDWGGPSSGGSGSTDTGRRFGEPGGSGVGPTSPSTRTPLPRMHTRSSYVITIPPGAGDWHPVPGDRPQVPPEPAPRPTPGSTVEMVIENRVAARLPVNGEAGHWKGTAAVVVGVLAVGLAASAAALWAAGVIGGP